jgi:hypothetical protein
MPRGARTVQAGKPMTVKVMGLACPRGVLALLSGMSAPLSVAFLARFWQDFDGLPRKLRSVRPQFQLPQYGAI